MIFFQAHYLRQFLSYFGVRILYLLAGYINIYIFNACSLTATHAALSLRVVVVVGDGTSFPD